MGTSDIFSLGTSNRSAEEFVALLKGNSIDTVVDVRRFPNSRYSHFRKEELARFLSRAGIEYVHMGEELGGYRAGGYEAFAQSAEFQAALSRVEEICHSKTVAIVCAERLPWKCHRRFIAFELEKRGWNMSHIIEKGKYWQERGSSNSQIRLPGF